MPLTNLTCPICLGTLKLKTAVAEGARLRCPKCKGTFLAEAEPKAPPPDAIHEAVSTEAQQPMPEPASALGEAEAVLEAEPDPAPVGRPRPRRENDYDRPRSRPARRDDYEDEEAGANRYRRGRKKGGVSPWIWLAAGGGALVLLLGCCGVGGIVAWNAAGGSGPVSVTNYNQLRRGMTTAQVHGILGQPSTSSASLGGIQIEKWQNGTDYIQVTFQNGAASIRSCNIQNNGWIRLQDSGLLPW